MEKIYISRFDLQRWSLEDDISFCKIYIWDLGVRFRLFLLGLCNPNLVLSDEFAGCIFKLWKVSFLKTFTSENEILIIKEQYCIWIFIFDIDQEQIYNVMNFQLINCLFNPPLPASP